MAEAQRDEIAKLEALYAANPEGHVFTHLAEAYRKAGELDRAKEILDQGLQRHPESASAHVVLGRVEHDRADDEAARRAFTRVLSLDGGNLIALRFLGDLALERGDRAEALGHYRDLLSRDVTDAALQQTVQELSRSLEPEPSVVAAPGPEAASPWAEPPGEADVAEAGLPAVDSSDEAVLATVAPAATTEAAQESAEEPAEWVPDDQQPAEGPSEWVPGEPVQQPSEEPVAERIPDEPAELVTEAPFPQWEPMGLPEPDTLILPESETTVPLEREPVELEGEDVWAPGEPEFLSIELAAVDEAPELASLETDTFEGEGLEFLSIDEEVSEAPGEYLVLEAAELDGTEPEFPAAWLEPEPPEPPGDVAAEAFEIQAVEIEVGDSEYTTAELVTGEVAPAEEVTEAGPGAEPEWLDADAVPTPTTAEQTSGPEPQAVETAAEAEAPEFVQVTSSAEEPQAEAATPSERPAAGEPPMPGGPAPAAEEPMVLEELPLQTAAEAELVLAAAFEPPSEAIPALEELTPLGDVASVAQAEPRPSEPVEEAPQEAAAGLFTETMAELYRTQGFPERAAEVYRWLLVRDPDNVRLQQLLAESEAGPAAPELEPPRPREWLQELQSVESAFTGGAGAAAHQDSPYVWTGTGEEPAHPGPTIGAYFRELLAWRPLVGGGAAGAGELVLDEVVSEEVSLGDGEPVAEAEAGDATELMPWEFAEPPALATVEPPLEPLPAPDAARPAEVEGDQDQVAGEVEAEDEDLEMFRSWLQSLKK